MKQKQVIILGAGAAGLMCAIAAAANGKQVLVLDRANKVGKKILMSGGGRCNFTNLDVQPENFISLNPHFSKSALSRYTQWDFIHLVEQYQIPYEERKHGQLFCQDSAKDILQMLISECEKNKVTIKSQCEINKVDATAKGYRVQSSLGDFHCDHLVLATGGLSIPTLGGSDFGYRFAQTLELDVIPRQAGLVPFTFSDYFKDISERLSGLAHHASVSVVDKKNSPSFEENILFTHRGLSGPAILQISNYWQSGESINIDLAPQHDLEQWFLEQKQEKPKALLKNVLGQLFQKPLCLELEKLFWPELAQRSIAEIGDKQLENIARQLHHWQLKPSGTEGYRTAEVTLGGINTDELNSKTMESKKHKGLYFIGEVVDVTGHLGGYNFQWAWSSGYSAGIAIANS